MLGHKGPFHFSASSDPAVAKSKKNLEAAEARKTNNIKGTPRAPDSTWKFVGNINGLKLAERKVANDLIVIDAREAGLTKEQAQQIFDRAKVTYADKQIPGKVEIWTNEGKVNN